ncbi:MAG TPA: hypothetical protein VJ850_09690 [Candidatus Limnocylindrales bacterium]|nr:hypothetical protein [Candidatus Limnocylindrales bacterium]
MSQSKKMLLGQIGGSFKGSRPRDLLLQSNGGVCSRDAARHTGDPALFWQGVTNANDGNTGTQTTCGGGVTAYTDYLKCTLAQTYRVTRLHVYGSTANDFDGFQYWDGSAWQPLAVTWNGLGWNNPAGADYAVNGGYVDAQEFAVKARQQASSGLTLNTLEIWGDDIGAAGAAF